MGQFPATQCRPELAALDLIIEGNLVAFWQRAPQRRCEDCGTTLRRDVADTQRLCAICLRNETLVSARRWLNVVDQITRIGGSYAEAISRPRGRFIADTGNVRERTI